jgi:hypothetical protein
MLFLSCVSCLLCNVFQSIKYTYIYLSMYRLLVPRAKRSRSRDRRRGRDSADNGVTVKDEPVDNGYEEQVRGLEYAAAMSVKQEKEDGNRRTAQPEA